MPKAPAWAKAKPSQARLLALGPAHDFPKPKPPKARPKPGLPGQAGAVTSLVVVDNVGDARQAVVVVVDDVGDPAKPLSSSSTTWETRQPLSSLSSTWVTQQNRCRCRRRRG